MKKLLIFMLIVGMASVASAALTLNISATTIDPGQTATVTVWQTVPNAGGSGGLMTIDVVSNTGTATVASPWNLTTGFAAIPPGSANGEPALGFIWAMDGGAYLIDADTFGFGKSAQLGVGTPGTGTFSAFGNPYVGTVRFDVVGVSEGWVDLTWGGIWDSVAMNGVVGGSIYVTPEPMTLALLGLGGLFLRRRK